MVSIRVIVIDDSAFMRKVISNILESSPTIEVIATARNGEDGLKKIQKYEPDVVTLDVEMPIMGGMETLEKIMKYYSLPVVMLSSVSDKDKEKVVQAMSKGAVDFIEKPSGAISLNITDIKDEIVKKVLIAAEAKVSHIHHDEKPLREITNISKIDKTNISFVKHQSIVAIGTSTGGPKALLTVLKEIPKDFQAPIVIVQHMPPGFTKSLAERLDHNCHLQVKEAEDGDVLQDGTVYITPGDYHMVVIATQQDLKIKLTKAPKRNGHRPSVDVLFESVAAIPHVNKLAVVLTGMGNDGAQGVQQLKKLDRYTIIIAENKESSVVYGMPKAAKLTNCVDYIVHLQEVCSTIIKIVNKTRGK